MTLHIETVSTPDGLRYIGVITPNNHPAITEVGTGWCLSPAEAEAQAYRHYALALQAYEAWITARKAQEAKTA